MKRIISNRTNYSKSPVLIVENNNGSRLKVALNSSGEIYRLIKFSEKIEFCESVEIETSEKTEHFIKNWLRYFNSPLNVELYKLDTIQQYYLLIHGEKISNNPLYALTTENYYPASYALEYYKKSEEKHKELMQKSAEIRSLKNQLRIVQAKLKVPAKMAEMQCNERQALAYVLGGKLYHDYFEKLFAQKIIRPNGYTGSGKYCSKGSDKAAAMAAILTDCGIKHTTGNDAPKGGFSGNYIKIK